MQNSSPPRRTTVSWARLAHLRRRRVAAAGTGSPASRGDDVRAALHAALERSDRPARPDALAELVAAAVWARAGRHAPRRASATPPPTIEEIVAVTRHAGDSVHGRRLRGLIVVLWRAGLRIHEARALSEAVLDPRRARCWCAEARAAAAARWDGRLGVEATRALAIQAETEARR
jgi:hypothetical protein